MASWKKGQSTYQTLVSNIGAWVTEGVSEIGEHSETTVTANAKTVVPEFVSGLRVMDLTDIHEYLMYRSEINPDPHTPTYVYSGGDRIISVTRYLLKNIDLEMAKLYA